MVCHKGLRTVHTGIQECLSEGRENEVVRVVKEGIRTVCHGGYSRDQGAPPYKVLIHVRM